MRIALNGLLAAVVVGVGASGVEAQELPAQRLSAIVGVAVEEYGKAVDVRGRLISAVELDEATGFLQDARDVAKRLTTADADLTRVLLDSLAALAERRATPAELRDLHARFTISLGAAGALDRPTRAIDVAEGKELFVQQCASCHGVHGNADGANAALLNPRPARLSDAVLLKDVTPALLYRILAVGVQGTAMAGWSGALTPDQRWALVSYLNTLRATDADRARGQAVLNARSAPEWRTFEWQVERSDAQLSRVLLANAVAPGDVPAAIAALRAAPEAGLAQAGTSSADAARAVVRTLDDALVALRNGRRAEAGDRAFLSLIHI